MCDETNEERQDNELAALQAIYGNAVVDNRVPMAWKVWQPIDLLLTLNPLHNSDIQGIHCSVTLHFKCCPMYPDKPPLLAVSKMHGLSTDNANKLLAELESLAAKQCGEVMIFQLASHAQQFLHDHNKPTLSFYEEMVKQKDEKEKLKLLDKQVKENEERQKIKEEIQRRQDILRDAGKQRTHRPSMSQENGADEGQGDSPELVCYADEKMLPSKKQSRNKNAEIPCTCNSREAQILKVTQKNNKKVYIGNCIGHSSNGSVTYLSIDDETGECLVTKKWSIRPSSDFQIRNRQVTTLQQDLKAMNRLKHSALVPYVAMEMCKQSNKTSRTSNVYIFRSFVLGVSLKYLKSKLCLSDKFEVLRLLRHVGAGVFGALKELHSVGVLHRDVRCENVYLDDIGGVKLVGAGLDAKLTEMADGDSYCESQTAAQDIYATAQLLLTIVAQDRSYLEIPPDLPTSAKDFFSRCLTEDEHSQWTAEQLVNHVFLIDTPTKEPGEDQVDHGCSGSEDDEAVKKIHHTSPATNGHSRLNAEFEVLTWLGSGAFGDVLKVKNKLDGGFYAIKRVQLNPESVNLNKKITREVKLLSRLNHENVVRYYNAWIESTTEPDEDESVHKTTTLKRRESLEDVIAKLGQGVKVEWSMSEGPVCLGDDDDDEDDDEPDPWFNASPEDDESSTSDGIEFEDDSDNKSLSIPSQEETPQTKRRNSKLNQVLYIQMEFCEKHTLRQAIDNGLYQENFRAWRLFREMVEGLAHVHQRGMIHRDLKPVNIFLDSNDHVKIGDFGLATKAITGLPVDEKIKPQEEIGGSLTGQIGTALYVAPELVQASAKVIYNQKVDLYSLGIILFEMFHPPLNTGMERITVLTHLRSKDIDMPRDFERDENSKQIHVIRWLLNHEASHRPTCAELLASEHVPRPVPENALSGLLSHALSDRGSRGYQRLVAACLDQRLSAAEDYTYHNGMRTKPMDVFTVVKDAVVKIFRSHGAIEFSPPLLIPRAKAWDQYPNAFKVMTSSGSVCHLPHDLRLPFARHTAYTGTKYIRRYVVDRVYRTRVQGFHPREIIECGFDIVTPKTVLDTLWSDAELLVVASRAATESSLKVTLQLNHTELLKFLLLSCGVPLDKHVDIYPVLVDVSFGRITSLQLQTHLTSLCITNQDVSNLRRLMEADVHVHELKELVTPLVKPAKWNKIIIQAVHELEAVCRNAKALGCECSITIAPFLAYNATQHSGVFWQMSVVRNNDYKTMAKHRSGDLIAAGGRYDALVEEFWQVARTEKDHDNSELKSCSVGFSMSLERMAAVLKKTEHHSTTRLKDVDPTLICVCVWGTAGSSREGQAAIRRAQLARELWVGGYTCCPWVLGVSEAHELSGAGIILYQDDACMRVSCIDGNRMREHKVAYVDVLDFIKQLLNPDIVRTPEANRTPCWNENEKSNSPITSVTFITANERITKNSKRHCENQINTQMSAMLVSLGMQPLLGRCRVSVVALACEGACVRLLAAHLAPPLCADDLPRALAHVAQSFPQRQEILEEALRELINIAKQSNKNRSNDETQLYALYSIPDSLCRLIT